MYTHAYIQENADSWGHVVLVAIFVRTDDRDPLDKDFPAGCADKTCFPVGCRIDQDHWGFPQVFLSVRKVENRLARRDTE